MRDENPIRTLGDYSKPSHEGYRNTIELPVGNNVVPLQSDIIWERTRLHLFQFSLYNQASNWLECFPAGSITTWEDLTTRFVMRHPNLLEFEEKAKSWLTHNYRKESPRGKVERRKNGGLTYDKGMLGMIRGKGHQKRSYERMEPWMDNEISFPSVPGCQLVDSPIILEALIEVFQVQRIYVNGESSLEVTYEHCFRNLGTKIKAKLKESRVPLVGFCEEVNYLMGVIDLNVIIRELDRL
ncbi:hypothetical protein Tco_0302787 [Tanacetum coccineum]